MYEPSNHVDSFFIAGFQFGDGADVLSELVPGTPLELVAEPDNPHDPDAVAIRYGGMRLGYIPAEKNEWPALLLRFGHTKVLGCKVIQCDPTAAPYHQVRVKLFVRDAR